MSESQTVAVLEWGTSKVKVLLAEIVDGNRLNIISKSSADTLTSVRKGDIIDVAKVYNKTRDAVINAENKASVKIKTVSLAISGTHIKTFRNLGSANISSPDGAVRREDVERAKEDAKRKTLESGRSYIQRICCGYSLDDKPCIDPVGKTGSKIDAEYLMIHGDNERLIEIANIVRSAGLEFDDIILSGIASAIAVTSAKQKTDGVLVADIGAGTTDYAFIKNGKVVAAGVIPVGGNHVTNDIALGLHLSPKTAENVKISCGKLLLTEDERKKIYWAIGDKQIGDKKILGDSVNKIVRARVIELLEILREDVSEFLNENGIAEVVLTGGASNTEGLCELAAEIFSRPCSRGKFSGSLPNHLRMQSWATTLGVLEHIKMREQKRSQKKSGIFSAIKEIFF